MEGAENEKGHCYCFVGFAVVFFALVYTKIIRDECRII